jgi:hypothetical protein
VTAPTDTRIQTATNDIRAAIEAMTRAKTAIGELMNEGVTSFRLGYAVVDLGWCIGKAQGAIADLRKVEGEL